MGLAGHNRRRRLVAEKAKLEHDEGQKILTEKTETVQTTEEKNIEVMQDAADAEERKRKAPGATVRHSDSPEETQAKNEFVLKDAEAATRRRARSDTTTVHASDTPEETEAKSKLVQRDAQAAEKAKENAEGSTVAPTPEEIADEPDFPVDPEKATAEAEKPKRSRRKVEDKTTEA